MQPPKRTTASSCATTAGFTASRRRWASSTISTSISAARWRLMNYQRPPIDAAPTDEQTMENYDVFALRVGSNSQRTTRENFFFDACCGPPDASMPLDYFFWVL